MGSWKRTITSPFRKACTILTPQASRPDHHPKKAPHRRQPSIGGGDNIAEMTTRSSQLYGDVMACPYEDVQVMWSMLDNKARISCTAAAS